MVHPSTILYFRRRPRKTESTSYGWSRWLAGAVGTALGGVNICRTKVGRGGES
jgi:hypothetical protein